MAASNRIMHHVAKLNQQFSGRCQWHNPIEYLWGVEDLQHRQAANKSIASWSYHMNISQNLWGIFLTSGGIYAAKVANKYIFCAGFSCFFLKTPETSSFCKCFTVSLLWSVLPKNTTVLLLNNEAFFRTVSPTISLLWSWSGLMVWLCATHLLFYACLKKSRAFTKTCVRQPNYKSLLAQWPLKRQFFYK